MTHPSPGRGIPSGGVARRSHMVDMLAPRALPAGRRTPGLWQVTAVPGNCALQYPGGAMTQVYLVGAGPGDPSLITVRGLRCLERADVVVYDHLVHPRLLSAAPAHAERIDVGAAAPQPGEQDAICMLVAEKAREGKIVVRLKWGDPFFFDSGGKEAIFLHEQGIAFEVVPGLPAGIAVPSYAGVPVTYPGAGESVTFVKGFEDGSQTPAKIDWMALAHLGGTVVCYAGARQVPARPAVDDRGRARRERRRGASSRTARCRRSAPSPARSASWPSGSPASRGAARRSSSSARSPGCASTCAGSTRGRSSASASSSRGRASRRSSWSIGSRSWARRPSRAPPSASSRSPTRRRSTRPAAPPRNFDWLVFTSQNGVDHFMRRVMEGPGDVRSRSRGRASAPSARPPPRSWRATA